GGLEENHPHQFDSDHRRGRAPACWLSALSCGRVSSNPGAGGAPDWAPPHRSAPAAEKLDINTAPKISSRHFPASGTPIRRRSSTGAPIAASWIWWSTEDKIQRENHREAAEGHRDGPFFPK